MKVKIIQGSRETGKTLNALSTIGYMDERTLIISRNDNLVWREYCKIWCTNPKLDFCKFGDERNIKYLPRVILYDDIKKENINPTIRELEERDYTGTVIFTALL